MKGKRIAQLELILKSHPEGLRKAEIARRLGVHRSTIGRYIDELKQYSDIYEDKGLLKINPDETSGMENLSLSVYEGMALNLGAEMLLKNSTYSNPHLASALRKVAIGIQSYAPKISESIMSLAEDVDSKTKDGNISERFNEVMEALIDAWVSGRMIKIHNLPEGLEDLPENLEEEEFAPYFIGFVDTEKGRSPITVTGRLRHSTQIITLDISRITSATILNETYTIPDNLKAFKKIDSPMNPNSVIDTMNLSLLVSQKSALNSFDALSHGPISMEKQKDGKYLCTFETENSIEVYLRIIQCGDAVEVIGPPQVRDRFVETLEKILNIYKNP